MNEKIVDIFLRRLGIPQLEASGKIPPGTSQAVGDAVFRILNNENVNRQKQILDQLGVNPLFINKEINESRKFLNSFSNKQKQFLGNRGVFNYNKGTAALKLLENLALSKVQLSQNQIEQKWGQLRKIIGPAAAARNRLKLNFLEIQSPSQSPSPSSSPSPSQSNNADFIQQMINAFELKYTNLHLTLYNGTIKKTSPTTVNLQNLVIPTLTSFNSKKYGDYTVKLVEVSGHSKTRFKKIWTISKEFINSNIGVGEKPGSIVFKVRLTKNKKSVGASVTMFSNGTIKFSGGFIDVVIKDTNNSKKIHEQPEIIKKYILENYTTDRKNTSNKINYNNLAGIFRIGSIFDLTKTIAKANAKYKGMYEQELSPRATFKLENCKIQLDASGVVQLKGMKEPLKAFKEAIEFINKETVRGQDVNLNINPLKFGVGRIVKRVNNQPAPNIKRRGTTCPKKRCPIPYSFQGKCQKQGKLSGDKFYVKPNPQGHPCCYKKPKSTKYLKNKVKNQYNKANVKVPTSVGTLFGINLNNGNKNNNMPMNVPNVKVVNDPKLGIKINSRQCMRYTKQKLYEIATRMKIQYLRPQMTKEQLCNEIKKHAKKSSNNKVVVVSFTDVGGKVYVLTGQGKTLRLGRRLCQTYSKPDLLRFARRFGIVTNSTMSKEKICLEFEKKIKTEQQKQKNKNAAALQKQKNKNAAALQKQKNNAVKKKINSLGLTTNIILGELPKLYGVTFMKQYGNRIRPTTLQQQSKYMLVLINDAIKTGKINMTKASIDSFKKKTVSTWKKQYIEQNLFNVSAKNDLRRLVGNNSIKITNQVVQKFVDFVKLVALNGKLQTKNQIEKSKQLWVKHQKQFGGNLYIPASSGLNVEEI